MIWEWQRKSLRPQTWEVFRAYSHQCFMRSSRPVSTAVWVLLGKLIIALKLEIFSPPPTHSHLPFTLITLRPVLEYWSGGEASWASPLYPHTSVLWMWATSCTARSDKRCFVPSVQSHLPGIPRNQQFHLQEKTLFALSSSYLEPLGQWWGSWPSTMGRRKTAEFETGYSSNPG